MAFGIDSTRVLGAPRTARGGHRIGAMLDHLRREGFHVLQDVEVGDEGRVDYLVMGPTGVFALGTHARFDGSVLATARRRAERLEDALVVSVTPVVCPPGRQGGQPFRHEGVWVVRRDDLVPWLRAQQNEVLDFVRFPQFADRL